MPPPPPKQQPQPQTPSSFFTNLDTLVVTSTLTIDRPRSTPHPRIPHALYPVDYGHLHPTVGGDGDGVDVFRGSGTGGVVGVVLTADLAKRDVEVKILLDCTDAEVGAVRRFVRDVLGIGGMVVRRDAEG